jgi:hypothetical protein
MKWPVLLAFAASAAMASDVSVSEWAPPGTKVAIGINVRGLLNSPLAKDLGAQEQDLAAKLLASRNLNGFDPLKDVDRIWILSTGAGVKAPTLIVVRGRFDAEQLAKDARRYHDIPILEIGNDGASIALIDSETAIAGEKAQVEAAIDRRGSGAELDADLMSRIDAAQSQYDIWGLGDCPDGLAAPVGGGDALRSIDRFAFGAALRDGLSLTATIHARTSEGATQMTEVLGMIEAALKMQQPKDGGLKFDLQSENGTFQIALSVPEEELRKGIEKQRAAMVSGVSKAESVAAKPAESTLPLLAEPPILPVLDSIPEVPSVPAVQPQPEVEAKAVVPPAAKPPVKPEMKAEIVKAPNGDTLLLKLPGK